MKSISVKKTTRNPVQNLTFNRAVENILYHDMWTVFHNAIWAPLIGHYHQDIKLKVWFELDRKAYKKELKRLKNIFGYPVTTIFEQEQWKEIKKRLS
jgi:hypothetical protein